MADEFEPITSEEARKCLNEAIQSKLGANWDDEVNGWTRLTGHDFMARFTKGNKNIDFYVDLEGKVSIEEKEVNPAQTAGRSMAWLFLLGSLVVASLLARLAGYL